MDLKSCNRWDEGTLARDEMFKASDTPWAPRYVANSEDKKRVRLNLISHLLKQISCEELPQEKVKFGKWKISEYKSDDIIVRLIEDRTHHRREIGRCRPLLRRSAVTKMRWNRRPPPPTLSHRADRAARPESLGAAAISTG